MVASPRANSLHLTRRCRKQRSRKLCNYDVQALVEQLQGHEGAATLEFIQRQMTSAETRHQFATSTRALDQENLVKLSSKLQAVQRELNAANEAASHEHERANRADAELSLVKGQLQTAQHNSDYVLQQNQQLRQQNQQLEQRL